MHQSVKENIKAIYVLWLNWVVVSGAISLLVVLSLWVKPLLMPLVAFAFQGCCMWMGRANERRRVPVCFVLPHIAVRIMFLSGVVMLIVNLLYSRWMVDKVFDPEVINREIPFIATLIVAPITFLCTLHTARRGRCNSFCQRCKDKYGTPAERGFMGILFTQEGMTQVRVLCYVSGGVTIVAWAYYFMEYVNVNFNAPDRFFFFIVPVVAFVLSIISMGLRYIGLWYYYCRYIGTIAMRSGPHSMVRFLVIWDNCLCVVKPEQDPDKAIMPNAGRYDTPVEIYIDARERLSAHDAAEMFALKTGVRAADVRFMYSPVTGNADYNIFHFLCFLDDAEKEKLTEAMPGIEFITLGRVRELINHKLCNPLLSAEFIRLYEVAMAWKTYDREGRRLYKIKHYVPTFRIRDIHKWGVDYNDIRLLQVSRFNEDSPFYHLRRFWRRYFTD